jgi:signal transduction histidine kinase
MLIEFQNPKELQINLLLPLINYVRDNHGEQQAGEILSDLGLNFADMTNRNYWISLRQFEAILSQCRDLMKDDSEFQRASTYKMLDSYGPLLWLLRTLTIEQLWKLAVQSMPKISKISKYEILELKSESMVCKYTTSGVESRLMCLSRQAQVQFMPTIWGLPEAQLSEKSCVAHGDPACIYELTWYKLPKYQGALVGILLGIIAMLLLIYSNTNVHHNILWLLFPTIGGLIGHLINLNSVNRKNLAFAEKTNEDLRNLTASYQDALEEVFNLHDRQRAWDQIQEERINDRTESLHKIIQHLQSDDQTQVALIRSLSHDIRAPLTVIKLNSEIIRSEIASVSSSVLELLEDNDLAIDSIDNMLIQLVKLSHFDETLNKLLRENLEIDDLCKRLKRRISALTFNKDIRTSVFRTREAPVKIETNLLLFDRIIDNLLMNACRYTDRGSILIEVSGAPQQLVLKISDTGKGISNEYIEKVFQIGNKGEQNHIDSYGLGLPNVIRLLDQLGGRLEVMSRPMVGSTFWLYFPLVNNNLHPQEQISSTIEEVFGRVVKIRRQVTS